jgi:hypothetical protein
MTGKGKGVGRALFAALLLMLSGIVSIIYGIAAIGNSAFFQHDQRYLFASLKGWGWITLIIGILEIAASLSLFGGGKFGRYFGIAVGSVAALGALLDLPAYPLWSLAVFWLSLWIIYGLAVYQEPEGPLITPPAGGSAVSFRPPPPM